ncbi:hypothetical protein GIB67_019336 [Kingdonia uniflora]|uniref:Aquaporin n=1 Tax=Kingdonia uniflora TaxID=39325 RepID=A0A7J7M1R8_9MAGN|nr:hypothetical protein GIB67_019336 [Kingdonia uniflora]
MNQTITIVGVSVVWGLAVLVMVYTLGHVSGSHFNPAITFAFAVSCMFPWKQVPLYIGSQITGSILAILTLNMLFNGQQVQQHDFHISITMTKFDTSYFHAIMWEFIISFILMFVVCGVATDHRGINELSGVAVGATVLLNILIAGPTTGASMNPARSIGPALVSHEFKQLWVYIVAPVLGTTAATAVYCLIRVPVSDKSDIASKSA